MYILSVIAMGGLLWRCIRNSRQGSTIGTEEVRSEACFQFVGCLIPSKVRSEDWSRTCGEIL